MSFALITIAVVPRRSTSRALPRRAHPFRGRLPPLAGRTRVEPHRGAHPGQVAGRRGQGAAPSTIEAFAVGEDGTAHPLPFGATRERLAPGRFRAHAKTAGEPFIVVRARDANGGFVGEAI